MKKINDSIERKIIFTEEVIHKVDSFKSESKKMYRPLYKYKLI